MDEKVFVGMSGGVDSSVSAWLLQRQGYEVTGVYMKNWSEDLPGIQCPWAEDLADAKRVAVRLGIDFQVWDFEKEYRERVVEYMLREFRAGRTPNPDIMCNQEIKFKLFYERARAAGADWIATGHYAQAVRCGELGEASIAKDGEPSEVVEAQVVRNEGGACTKLGRAVDENKDQTYFLYRISQEALEHTLFPLGKMLKPEVKKLAAEAGLHNAYKKESMGVCFVGEVGMRDFLQTYIETEPGEIRERESDRVIGSHEGAVFYTIGQRHGLYLSGVAGETNSGLPYYVVGKDLARNIVYVSRDLNAAGLWAEELELEEVVWRGGGSAGPHGSEAIEEHDKAHKPSPEQPREVLVRLRHRGELLPAQFDGQKIHFANKIRRPAAGQSAVFYDERYCLGGGIIV